HEEAAAASAADRIELIAREQRKVAGVRLERRIEDVACKRNRADHRLERDVADHAQQNAARRTEAACFVDDESGEQRADRIAETGHEPDGRIEPDAIAARQRNRVVEQPGERAQAAHALRSLRRVGSRNERRSFHVLYERMSATQVPAVEAFYHALTGAYAYLVYDPRTRHGVVVDPVLDFDRRSGVVTAVAAEQMLARIRELQLQVQWILETHAHADHLSAAAYMKDALGCQVATGAGVCDVQITAAHVFDLEPQFPTDGSQFERLWNDGDRFRIGEIACSVIATPGHTPDSVTYLIGDCAFVGDTLFLPYLGTARCDFPGASAADLYDSIRKLYRLPDATRVMTGHDYPQPPNEPAYCADIGSEKQSNVHLSAATTREEFVAFRQERDRTLALPELFFFALQVNVRAGRFPAEAANGTRQLHVPIHLPQTWSG